MNSKLGWVFYSLVRTSSNCQYRVSGIESLQKYNKNDNSTTKNFTNQKKKQNIKR